MTGTLGSTEIEHVLKSQLLGHIGCNANNITYVVPICYAYNNNCIYGRTFDGMKIKIIRENANVCFQVEHLENMGNWQSVICWGKFEELTDKIRRDEGIGILQNRISAIVENRNLMLSHYWPFSPTKTGEVEGIIFCIRISEKTGKSASMF